MRDDNFQGKHSLSTSNRQDPALFVDKYEKAGIIGNFLIKRFYASARRLFESQIKSSGIVLEVGCGPGYSTLNIRNWKNVDELIATDTDSGLLNLARELNPDINFNTQSIYDLDYPDKSFDAIVMLEVLEHLENPGKALNELNRVCRGIALLSTPREPLWRMLNLARGKYIGDLGNTPGHIQHWSSRGLRKEVSSRFEVISCAKPIPWTILLLKPN